nr:MAG TPA: hypothetical protein [Caudoviricetes sp.]
MIFRCFQTLKKWLKTWLKIRVNVGKLVFSHGFPQKN